MVLDCHTPSDPQSLHQVSQEAWHPYELPLQDAREEGGLDYKTSITDSIITIIKDRSKAKEIGESIECKHTSLAVRILHSRMTGCVQCAAMVFVLARLGALCDNLLLMSRGELQQPVNPQRIAGTRLLYILLLYILL